MTEKVQIQLPKDQVGELRDYYQNKLAVLQSQVNEIVDILNQFNTEVTISKQLNRSKIDMIEIDPGGFNSLWTYQKKIKYVLESSNTPLTTKQIVDTLINDLEPELQPFRKKVVASVSGLLGQGVEKGIYIRSKNDNDENLWTLIKRQE